MCAMIEVPDFFFFCWEFCIFVHELIPRCLPKRIDWDAAKLMANWKCVMDARMMSIFAANSVDEPLHNLYGYERARNWKSSHSDKDAENHVLVTCMHGARNEE